MAFFDDELRSPALVGDLALALLELAGRDESGVLHLAGPEALSRYELALLVARARACRRSACAGEAPPPRAWCGPRTACSTRAAPGHSDRNAACAGPRQLDP